MVYNLDKELKAVTFKLLKFALTNYENDMLVDTSLEVKHNSVPIINLDVAEHMEYIHEDIGDYLVVYEGYDLTKYFSGIMAEALSDSKLQMFRDYDTGKIEVFLTVHDQESLVIPESELTDTGIDFKDVFDNLDRLREEHTEA